MLTCGSIVFMGCFGVASRPGARITVSVVSHGQGDLVAVLLGDLARCHDVAAVILTQNIPEPEIQCPDEIMERIQVIRNVSPLGFAANHNAAFQRCATPFFCILNPDIRLPEDPFSSLLDCFADSRVALAAPAVTNNLGEIEDSARAFPTPLGLFMKIIGVTDGRLVYRLGDQPQRPDWIAGMFLLVRSEVFHSVGGFDAGFHLYYEDVDLCARLRKMGHDLLLCPSTHVIHDARRSSRRNLRYFLWHLSSMSRYFLKHLGRIPKRNVTMT